MAIQCCDVMPLMILADVSMQRNAIFNQFNSDLSLYIVFTFHRNSVYEGYNLLLSIRSLKKY